MARTDKGYEIKFTDIKKPEICLTAFGPATATIPLDLKPGNYELNFVLRGKTNQFTLSVKDGTYEITGGNGSNVTMGNTKVLSVPADTYWGTMWDHTGDDMTMHYTWLDSALKKKGLTPAKMEPGDYRSFTVDANGNYAGVGAPNEISYIYKYTGDVNELKPLFEQFPDSVTVRLQNAQNILLTN